MGFAFKMQNINYSENNYFIIKPSDSKNKFIFESCIYQEDSGNFVPSIDPVMYLGVGKTLPEIFCYILGEDGCYDNDPVAEWDDDEEEYVMFSDYFDSQFSEEDLWKYLNNHKDYFFTLRYVWDENEETDRREYGIYDSTNKNYIIKTYIFFASDGFDEQFGAVYEKDKALMKKQSKCSSKSKEHCSIKEV